MITVTISGVNNLSTKGGSSNFKIWTEYATGSQIIDINDAFGVIGIGPGHGSMTGSVSVTTDLDRVSMSTDLLFAFTT